MTADQYPNRPDRSQPNESGHDDAFSLSADVGDSRVVDNLVDELTGILTSARQFEERFGRLLENVHPNFARSARNLLHYLALRNVDRRPLQQQLAKLGLSSLGRAEAHVSASLHAVLRTLHCSTGRAYETSGPPIVDFDEGTELLAKHADDLLGRRSDERDVRIMVTLSPKAAENYAHVLDLVREGMNCARINCAKDGPETWSRMATHVRRAEEETGLSCRILMDLGGPKLRTGSLEPGPRVVSWEPTLDLMGRIDRPAVVWMSTENLSPPEGRSVDAVVPLREDLASVVEPGDRVVCRDTRGRQRHLTVVGIQRKGFWAEGREAVHIAEGATVEVRRKTGRRYARVESTVVESLSPRENPILLRTGDSLILRADQTPGRPALRDDEGKILEPAVVSCTLPEVFSDLNVGETVKFDDGKIEGVIRSVSDETVNVEITQARASGRKLRGDRSINLPDSKLHVTGLTEKDRSDLDFVTEHADIVGLSFVREPGDIRALQEELDRRGAGDVGIMLKIETQRGFQQLPLLLLTAMHSYPVGVMIARGDLAVECGWERMAEVQEEILWLAEAGHVPVVWATQVLESLAKRGFPSRAEITDAAMAQRAECVMLNKGPHILETIRTLDDILQRMQAHQSKKTSTLRSLLIARMDV